MLKIILNCFINYFCPQENEIINNDELYFRDLLIKSNEDFINSLSIKKYTN